MEDVTTIEINMETHIKKFLALLDIKFALLNNKEHIQINDYEIGSHLSLVLSNGIQLNILIDEEVQNIYFSTVLEKSSCLTDLDSVFAKCRVPATFIERSEVNLQIFRSIPLTEKVDVASVIYELKLIGRLAHQLINKFPRGLCAGVLNEENFYYLGSLDCVKTEQKSSVD